MNNEEMIKGLWSASVTLASHAPLNKKESEAVAQLLNLVLGKFVPTVQEYNKCQEAIAHMKNIKSVEEKQHFEPVIEAYEKKYALTK
jgi:hypothetical protein